MTEKPLIPDDALDRLFRTARSFNDFTAQPVTDAELRALYELAKWGPTTANSQPQRVVFVRSAEAKERLGAGDVVAEPQEGAQRAGGGDPRLRHALLRASAAAVPQSAGAKLVRDHAGAIRTTALRNATLQGAYLMLAARAVGLDCGPMSGFKNDVVDAAFFPDGRFKSNFLCCLGHGDPSTLPKQDYRFGFDEACTIV